MSMNISQNAVNSSLKSFKTSCFMHLSSASQSNNWSAPLPALAEQKCFKAISENVNNTLCLSCIPSTQAVVVGEGLREYRTCYNGQALAPFPPERLQQPQPHPRLPARLSHPVCPQKHAAKPNTPWWKTNTTPSVSLPHRMQVTWNSNL